MSLSASCSTQPSAGHRARAGAGPQFRALHSRSRSGPVTAPAALPGLRQPRRASWRAAPRPSGAVLALAEPPGDAKTNEGNAGESSGEGMARLRVTVVLALALEGRPALCGSVESLGACAAARLIFPACWPRCSCAGAHFQCPHPRLDSAPLPPGNWDLASALPLVPTGSRESNRWAAEFSARLGSVVEYKVCIIRSSLLARSASCA